MDIKKAEEEAAQLRTKFNAHIESMEQTAQQFMDAIKPFLAEWYQQKVKQTVIENPDIAEKASEDGRLTALKSELAVLVERVPEFVAEKFKDDRLWPHRNDVSRYIENRDQYALRQQFETYTNRMPEQFDEPMRLLLGLAGKLLETHGFINLLMGKISPEWDVRYSQNSKPIQYKTAYSVPESVVKVAKQYSSQFAEFISSGRTLQEKEKAIAEAKAKNLWDEA